MPGRAATAAGLGGVAALAIWLWWPGEERRIRAHLTELAEAASVPAAETDLARVARLGVLARGVAADVEFSPGGRRSSVTGRKALLGIAAQLSRRGPVEFRLADVDVEVDDTGLTATVSATVLVWRPPGSRELEALQGFEGQEVRVRLVTIDGQWLVRGAAVIDAVEHP
jgi:hypothetical protein